MAVLIKRSWLDETRNHKVTEIINCPFFSHTGGFLENFNKILVANGGRPITPGNEAGRYRDTDKITDGFEGPKACIKNIGNFVGDFNSIFLPLVAKHFRHVVEELEALGTNGAASMTPDETSSNDDAYRITNEHNKRDQIDDIIAIAEKLVPLIHGREVGAGNTPSENVNALDKRDSVEDFLSKQFPLVAPIVAALIHFDGFFEDLNKILANCADPNFTSNEVDHEDCDRSAFEASDGLHKRDSVAKIEALIERLAPIISGLFNGGSDTYRYLNKESSGFEKKDSVVELEDVTSQLMSLIRGLLGGLGREYRSLDSVADDLDKRDWVAGIKAALTKLSPLVSDISGSGAGICHSLDDAAHGREERDNIDDIVGNTKTLPHLMLDDEDVTKRDKCNLLRLLYGDGTGTKRDSIEKRGWGDDLVGFLRDPGDAASLA